MTNLIGQGNEPKIMFILQCIIDSNVASPHHIKVGSYLTTKGLAIDDEAVVAHDPPWSDPLEAGRPFAQFRSIEQEGNLGVKAQVQIRKPSRFRIHAVNLWL